MTLWLALRAYHLLTLWEPALVLTQVCFSLALGGLVWILYIAIEPFVRRRWPQVLVSWTRLISGDLRDPYVARDVFIGCAFGVLIGCLVYGRTYLNPLWFGHAELNWPIEIAFDTVLSSRFFISKLLLTVCVGILSSLGSVAFLFFLRILLRGQMVAIAVWVPICSWSSTPWSFAISLIMNALMIFVLMRFGLVAVGLISIIANLWLQFPTTLEASAWYSGYGFATLAVLAAIVLYAFRFSLGGRSVAARSLPPPASTNNFGNGISYC